MVLSDFVRLFNDNVAFDIEDIKLLDVPVDQYIGGVEHAILHLLYSKIL